MGNTCDFCNKAKKLMVCAYKSEHHKGNIKVRICEECLMKEEGKASAIHGKQ